MNDLQTALTDRSLDWIIPDWPAPANVHALMTTRNGDTGQGIRCSMNLARATGEVVAAVVRNRALLRSVTGVDPFWLSQTHGTNVAHIDAAPLTEADGAVVTRSGRAATVCIADCLPVLFCTADGSRVGAAHAGWRGLNAGILEATVSAMGADRDLVIAWLGPAIGPDAFEVGEDVYRAFTDSDPEARTSFAPYPGRPGKWLADFYALARMRLRNAGVTSIHGGGFCTFTDASRFFSYRRDKTMERMAALVWLAP